MGVSNTTLPTLRYLLPSHPGPCLPLPGARPLLTWRPVPPQVESRTLVMFRGITQQLQASCLGLMANVQGLPASIQDKVQQMRHHMEELHTSFSAAHSFQDLSSTVLTQSRERVTKARESLDELLDYVAQNAPLPWLVGPFAPVLVEHPENLAIGMEKKEDQATCPGQSREEKPAQQASEAKKAP